MSKQNAAGAAPQENKMGVLPVGKLLAGICLLYTSDAADEL